jgi:hypothetical protein
MKSQAQRRARLGRLAAVAGALALVGAAACTAKVEDKPKESEVTVKELSAPHGRHFRGPVQVVIDAARAHGNLTAEQEQTLDTIVAELEEDHGSHRQLRDKLKSSAVAVVRSGKANSEVFDQSVGEAVAAFEKRAERNADALEEIHGILEPDQRARVATALRAHIDEKFGKRPDHEKRHRDGFKRVASHLMLSTLQIDKLEALKQQLLGEKQRLRPNREELLALVDAFEGESFRAALNEFQDKKLAILREHVADAGERTDSALSILSPEQRVLLADLIQDGWRKVILGKDAAQSETDSR